MGNFPEKQISTIKEIYHRLSDVIEITVVLVALMLPVVLLSSQLEKINIVNQANPDCDLEKWLQSIVALIELS